VNPLILAIDTTHELGSLALLRGEELLEEAALRAPDGFAHVLYPELDALLKRHAVTAGAIDCFAAASGPGSFTGVRVGLACVKGLAEAASKPAVGVSNLQALASLGRGPLRAAMIDARRGEIYGAVYDEAGAPVLPEVVMPAEDWRKTLPEGAEIVELTGEMTLAAAIAKIALARLRKGEAGDPAALDANYVRRSDAELLFRL
jgi:tRNA threonylcarbamoyladenosine biosynthesis protein TsaB